MSEREDVIYGYIKKNNPFYPDDRKWRMFDVIDAMDYIFQEQQKKIDDLIHQRDEAVEALLKISSYWDELKDYLPEEIKTVIEKLTDQTWEEIKEGKI